MLSKTHTKYIQSLQHKKFRDEANLFIAEGPKLVYDLLAGKKFMCKEIIAVKEWLHMQNKIKELPERITVTEVEDFELKKISSLTTAHDVLAVFEKRKQDMDIKTSGRIVLALDAIQDPGNLGTIIRIADWFAVTDIVCAFGTADLYNPKVVQSTMGSIGRINVIYTHLPEWIKSNKNVKVYATSLEGKNVKLAGKLKEGIIVIGNEAKGVSDEVLELVDEKITIPKMGDAESLNAAVATGIILSHII